MNSTSINRPTYILGVYYGHNATACLLKDGNVISIASEERFNGIKNFAGFPKKAIDYVLKEANIASDELSFVTVSHKYGTPIHSMAKVKSGISVKFFVLLYGPIGIIRKIWGNLAFHFKSISSVGRIFYLFTIYTVGFITNQKEMNFLAEYLGLDRSKIIPYDHHLSHAASAYYSSPFNDKKVLVLTLDGEGDSFCASVNIFEKDKIKIISKTPRENSLGLLYAYLTEHLGMKSNEHEYKVMGLAPYAKDTDVLKVYENIKNIIKVDKEKLTFRSTFNTVDTEKFLHAYMHNVRFDILAGTFQKLLEDKIIEWIEASIQKTGVSSLALAGGVFMNVKVNKKIAESKDVKELFILPSCGDESSIIGSSYLAYLEECDKDRKEYSIAPIQNIYWGPQLGDREIEKDLKDFKALRRFNIEKVEDIEKETAKLLAKGAIVARVSGKMEFGARALGNRSILADPRDPDVVRIINEQVKNRDFWMPFAPSILKERAKDYIVNPKNLDSHYMMLSFDTTEKGRNDLRAAIHPSDFTVRPQIVERGFNQKYYYLLKEFEKLTGVGGVLNTSLNLHGYPIVLGSKEALYVFKNSGLEFLTIENYLLSKK